MNDRPSLHQTTPIDWPDRQVEGFDAFEAGKSLNDNPYGFRNGRDQWSRGWLKARARAVARFQQRIADEQPTNTPGDVTPDWHVRRQATWLQTELEYD